MLKPEQIYNATFTPVSSGTYSASEVDQFIKAVAEAYESVLNENVDLVKKISFLAEKVESYRQDEDAIKSALLDAHKMADNVTKTATDKANTLVEDAQTRADAISTEAERQAVDLANAARNQAAEIVSNAKSAVASIKERAAAEADATIKQAQSQANEIVSAASKRGEAIIGNSRKEYEFYSTELSKVKQEIANFRDMFEKLYTEEISPQAIADVDVTSPAPVFVPDEVAEDPLLDAPVEVKEDKEPIDELFSLLEESQAQSSDDFVANIDDFLPQFVANKEEKQETEEEKEETVDFTEEDTEKSEEESEKSDKSEKESEGGVFPFISSKDDDEDNGLNIPGEPYEEPEENNDFSDDDLDEDLIPTFVETDGQDGEDDNDDDITSLFDSLFD